MTRARILLADDHKEMRERVAGLLETEFDVIGAVGDGCQLLRAEAELHPDVCVVDISMPAICGIDVAHRVKDGGSKTQIVVLTIHDDPDFLKAALENGAVGYVLKSHMTSDLSAAVHEALAGRIFVSSSPRLNIETARST